jgi:hypothetical protein
MKDDPVVLSVVYDTPGVADRLARMALLRRRDDQRGGGTVGTRGVEVFPAHPPRHRCRTIGRGESLLAPLLEGRSERQSSMAKKLQPLEPRNLALMADLELEGAWRVEYFDSDGAEYIAIFAGQSAEGRARDYYDAIERGALNTRIADAQVGTPKKVVSFPQKRRRPLR